MPGDLLTKDDIKPQPKNVEEMQRVFPTMSLKQLKKFFGMVTYYQDMWPKRISILAPEVDQQAFTDVKAKLMSNTMLACPDFTEPFKVHLDTSVLQLGAMMSQGGIYIQGNSMQSNKVIQ